ncbi:GNAT family N-acetyltransferase [Sphaerimonospora cavernae]|uniref:GNAT family N-acetyltransferase n=1 Tax=Sphaerimonospora cavernae TaxID=1740611 RepID=A0ABV6UBB0_9ACTN
MTVPTIRVAEDADMPGIRGDVGAHFGLLTKWPETPDFLDAERAYGTLCVSEVGGRIVGFGGTVHRGSLTHLGDLFVLPDHQSTGLGRMILTRLLPRDVPKITFAANNTRAFALYIRHGMRPRCPLLYLEGPFEGGPPAAAEVGPQEAAALDARISGGDRTECLTWYAGLPGAGVRLGDGGYAFTRMIGDTLVIGPAGGETPQDSLDVMLRTIAAHPGAELIQVAVPGVHPLLPMLLDAGWRITDMDTVMTSEEGLVQLDRYLPHPDLG